MEKGKFSYNLEQIDSAARLLISLFDKCSIFTFTGDLGAGKTTLVKAILKNVVVKEVATSPTFAYVCKYGNDSGQIFYHFDLYRLRSADEFFNLGFQDLLYRSNSWAFIEWPEIILPFLKTNVCEISLEYIDEYNRMIFYKIKS